MSGQPRRFWVEPFHVEDGAGAGDEPFVVVEAGVVLAFVVVEPEIAHELRTLEGEGVLERTSTPIDGIAFGTPNGRPALDRTALPAA
jgi:hypothetical protein